MSEATCKTCPWWCENLVPSGSLRVGHCRKYAPAYSKVTVHGMCKWPATYSDDWCGEHPDRKGAPDEL